MSAKNGFASTPLPNGLAIAGTDQKGKLVTSLIKQDSLGKLNYTAALAFANAQTNVSPSVAIITNDAMHCCWTDHKDYQLRYADLNIEQKTWSPIQKKHGATTTRSTVVCRPFQNDEVFYFSETGKDIVNYTQGSGNQYGPA